MARNRELERKAKEESDIIAKEFDRLRSAIINQTVYDIKEYIIRNRVLKAGYQGHNVQIRDIITRVIEKPKLLINNDLLKKVYTTGKLSAHYYQVLRSRSKKVDKMTLKYGKKVMNRVGHEEISKIIHKPAFIKDIRKQIPGNVLAECLMQNPHYKKYVEHAYRRIRVIQLLSTEFLNSVPDNYAFLYPEARALTRHFFIHSGPTNSGKTYDAIMDLAKSENGVYLAPLRLLAYEQYERLTELGVRCSMITGEERILVEDATHQSSTTEILDLEREYETAVIDEGQMAADESRGGAWTTAILGVCAKTVHVCCSENFTDCLVKMIESCGDTYEIIEHKRKTPLVVEPGRFNYPSDIAKGDALIVFTRKDVHACAADLTKRGYKCSVIYGSLPYDVRHTEAAKFSSGETEILISTDAIGMGMNLPIRRVVFLRMEKFDGSTVRRLTLPEVKQIAGRAGRYGIYDVGYVNAYEYREWLAYTFNRANDIIEKAVIDIPPIFFEKDGSVSEILDAWNSLPATRDYNKSNIEERIQNAGELEKRSENKELILEFVSMPFDRTCDKVHELWLDLFSCMDEGHPADPEYLYSRFNPDDYDAKPRNTEHLEILYKVYDLLYIYASRHGTPDDLNMIMSRKNTISKKLNDIFSKRGFQSKVCTKCGRPIPWLAKFNLCDSCYELGT